jgi:8-oxo-dGTP diphosphatase
VRARAKLIKAAGTVTFRGSGKSTEVLVVHRHFRNDWSLPKGKLDKGEYLPATAYRETLEESGVATKLRVPLPPVNYDWNGTPKVVRYWMAEPVDPALASGDRDLPDDWQPNDEVDEIRWVRINHLVGLLTYPRDLQTVLDAFGRSRHTLPMILMRHADAQKRVDFADEHNGRPPHDNERPLNGDGVNLVPSIAAVLNAYGVTRVHSSPAKRCLETVNDVLEDSQQIFLEPTFSESGAAANEDATKARIQKVMSVPQALVVCSHRPVLPTLIRTVARVSKSHLPETKISPGGFVVFHRPLRPSGGIRTGHSYVTESSADYQ